VSPGGTTAAQHLRVGLGLDERDSAQVLDELDVVLGEIALVRAYDAQVGVDIAQEVREDDGVGGCSIGDGDCERRPSVVYCCVEFDEVLRPVCRMGEPAVEELGANAC